MSEATFYIWKKKSHTCVSELRHLRSLEEENARFKRVVADLSLDKHILTEALRKKSDCSRAWRHLETEGSIGEGFELEERKKWGG